MPARAGGGPIAVVRSGSERSAFAGRNAQLSGMADKKIPVGEGIGVPDPKSEPQPPPKIDSAGKLGPVGEHKQEKDDLNDRDGVWRNPAARGRDE